jgi:hypothetical protein
MPRPRLTYNTSVFVNCPFDAEYLPLFRATVFTIEWCGYRTRCALEVDDSGETRAEKLIRIIRDSRFGIHDISRTESNAEGLPRFIMPYEFGLFVGFKSCGVRRQARKAVLVLDRERYRYQKFLSDIAGQDIRSHGGREETIIREVRNWLQNQSARELDGADHVVEQYSLFRQDWSALLTAARKTMSDLDNYHDFYRLVCDWIEV